METGKGGEREEGRGVLEDVVGGGGRERERTRTRILYFTRIVAEIVAEDCTEKGVG